MDRIFEYYTLPKIKLNAFLKRLMDSFPVAGVVKRGTSFHFDWLTKPEDFTTEYKATVLPPKKFFVMPREEMLKFNPQTQESKPAIEEPKPFVLFGVRPSDVRGIELLDYTYSEGHTDPFYMLRRNKAFIVAINDLKYNSEFEFSKGVGTHDVDTGFNIMLYDASDENYVAVVDLESGQQLLGEEFKLLDKAQVKGFQDYRQAKLDAMDNRFPVLTQDEAADLYKKNWESPIWAQSSRNCLSCGQCTMVCPTCHCFNVEDEVELNLTEGSRKRHWDSCMLHAFTKVAGDHVFRPETEQRLRHRLNKKFNFMPVKFGSIFCTGCGRCRRSCPANIDIVEFTEKLIEEGRDVSVGYIRRKTR